MTSATDILLGVHFEVCYKVKVVLAKVKVYLLGEEANCFSHTILFQKHHR